MIVSWWQRLERRPWPLRLLLIPVLGFVLVQILFFALLVAGAAIPDRPIVRHLAADVESKMYGPTGLKDRMGGTSDSFTECVVVGVGLGSDETNPVVKAGTMPRISNCKLGAEEIKSLAAGKDVEESSYFRYWSGFTPITRPVLAVSGMTGVRLVSGALLAFSLVLAGSVLSRSVGVLAATGLLGPLIVSTNLMSTPSSSFSQAISISAYLAGVAVCAWGARRSLALGLLGCALSAAVFCYVDLLTTPSIGWALSAATIAGVTYVRTSSLRPTIVAVLAAGLLWPLVFAATWVSRWLFAIPFAGWNAVVEEVKTTVLFRTAGSYQSVRDELWAASEKNWTYWADLATAPFVMWVAVVVALVALLLSLRGGYKGILAFLVIALPMACVPFWYEALRNHSQIHVFFVYRCVPVGIGVGLFAALVAARVAWAGGPDSPSPESDPSLPAPVQRGL